MDIHSDGEADAPLDVLGGPEQELIAGLTPADSAPIAGGADDVVPILATILSADGGQLDLKIFHHMCLVKLRKVYVPVLELAAQV